MTRFSATTLDLSRLPVPAVIKDLDKDAILTERLAELKTRFEAAGIAWDVDVIESDPGVILQQVDTYRELLDKQAINDAVKAVLVPYATGTDLDALGVGFGVVRIEGEDDDRLRHRIQLAPDAYSAAGALGAYRYHALSVTSVVRDVGISVPAPGQVLVAVLSDEGDGSAPDELVASVRAVLSRDDIRPLTDAVTVKPAVIVPYAIDCRLLIPDGPDAEVVRAAATDSLQELARDRQLVGETIHASAIVAAAHVTNVLQVTLNEPAGDIAIAADAAGNCSDITVTTEVLQ